MKYIYSLSLLLIVAIITAGCRKSEIETYTGKNNIYFALPFEATPALDSSNVSLAFLNDNDSLVWKVNVRFSGPAYQVDRPYTLAISEQSTALGNTHYKPVALNRYIKAGKYADTIKIVFLKKDIALKTSSRKLILELRANENFDTGMISTLLDAVTGRQLNFLRQSVTVTSQLGVPSLSGNFATYLGTFSEKKMRLCAEVNSIASDQLYRFFLPTRTGAFATADLQQFALRLRNYLNVEKASGRTVFELDGKTEMKVASSYY